MARMIDGDAVTKRLRAWLESPHGENVYNSGYDDAIWHVLDVIEHMPTLTPPNEPLTLEELREMDGDPVWFDTIKRWGIVIVRSAEVSVLTKSGEFDVTRLKFYRRPPEGEEDT